MNTAVLREFAKRLGLDGNADFVNDTLTFYEADADGRPVGKSFEFKGLRDARTALAMAAHCSGLETHSGDCSNQNVIDPLGPWIDVDSCGYRR